MRSSSTLRVEGEFFAMVSTKNSNKFLSCEVLIPLNLLRYESLKPLACAKLFVAFKEFPKANKVSKIRNKDKLPWISLHPNKTVSSC
jgi:hypothetical protein